MEPGINRPEERIRDMDNNDENSTSDEMAKKLKAAGKKMEKAKTERQARAVKGGHLNPRLLEMVEAAGMTSEEKSGFWKVTSPGRSAKLYVAKKGGRVDLSFHLDFEGIKNLTEEEAKARHLGKVRGQLDFDQDDGVVLVAFGHALDYIRASAEVTARPVRQPKAVVVTEEPEVTEGDDTSDESEAAAG